MNIWITKMNEALAIIILTSLLGACSSGLLFADSSSPPPPPVPVPSDSYYQYLDLAEQAIRDKKYEQTKRLLEKIFLEYPEDPQAKLLLAEMQFSMGRKNLAALSFKRLFDIREVEAKAYQGYGLSLLSSSNGEEAAIYLKNALEIDPQLWRAWNALGYYYDERMEWDKSEASYGQAIEINPSSSILFNNRGFSRLMQQQTESAVEDLLRAVELEPDNKRVRLNLQLALATSGKYRQAMTMDAQNTPANGLNNVGYVALMQGDYTNAESFLTQAMEKSYFFHEKASENLQLLHNLSTTEEEATNEEPRQ